LGERKYDSLDRKLLSLARVKKESLRKGKAARVRPRGGKCWAPRGGIQRVKADGVGRVRRGGRLVVKRSWHIGMKRKLLGG